MNAESKPSKDGACMGGDDSLKRADRIRKIARALAQPVTYLGVAMLVFIYCMLTYLIISDRREAYKEALTRGENLVQIIDQSFSSIFKRADATLLFFRKTYQLAPSTFSLSAWVHDPSIRNELISNFAIIDANGRIVDASSSKKVIGLDISDREYFQKQRDSVSDTLLISKPLTLKFSQKRALVLSRRITTANGVFSGIVAVFINLDELGKTARVIDLGQDGNIALMGLDGVVRLRVVNGTLDGKTIGRKFPPTTDLLIYAAQAKSKDYWNKPGLIDNVRRLISYRVLNSFPMIALVAISEAEVYRRASENARIYWGISLTLTAAILVAIGFGARREQKLIETRSAIQQAQKALERSQERYRLVEDAVNDGIWDWNIRTDEDYLSPRWKAILNYADDELPNISSSFFDRIHPDDKAAVTEALHAHLEENKPYAVDLRLRCKDGGYCWVQSRGKAQRDAANQPIHMVGTITDITERKQAEVALAQAQERYALVESAVNDGIYDRNLLTDEVYLSPRWKSMLGYADDALPNVMGSFFDLIHPDDMAAYIEASRTILEKDEPYAVEFRLRCKDGGYRWMLSRGKIFCDASNRPVRALGTITDITERKQAEALIEESRNNLEHAETMALLGHYKLVQGATAFKWSEGVYRIYGKTPGSFTPTLKAVLDLTHPDDRPALEQYRRDVMEGLEPPRITLRAVMNDGQIKYIECWSKPILASDGTITGMFGTLQDVTVRKRSEDILARANQELEARVAERTADLAQEMRRREKAQMTLAQMQKMEAVGQLTAGIAHDFNNLLAVIQGSLVFVEAAAARGLSTEMELIDAALRATRRGRELVQRLLAFSRQGPLKAEPTRVDQLVLDTLRLLQRTLGEEIEIVTRLDATAALVFLDRGQLTNALLNLALNARDAMPEGGQLTIATSCLPAQWAAKEGATRWPTGEEIRIVITDTGTGMVDEVRERAFEPFFTTKRDGLGTGLGLSMVHGFVQQSGGHIEIDSEEERGTTVTIRLPRIAEAGQPEETATAGASTPGKQKTVLLVEDDPDVRTVTAAQLKQLGYKVHAVATGMEALDMIVSPASIDIALTDIVLPGGIDGIALVKELMRARPGIGILCMSGYDPTRKNSKWLKMQNIEFLEKPFSSTRLEQALGAVIV